MRKSHLSRATCSPHPCKWAVSLWGHCSMTPACVMGLLGPRHCAGCRECSEAVQDLPTCGSCLTREASPETHHHPRQVGINVTREVLVEHSWDSEGEERIQHLDLMIRADFGAGLESDNREGLSRQKRAGLHQTRRRRSSTGLWAGVFLLCLGNGLAWVEIEYK